MSAALPLQLQNYIQAVGCSLCALASFEILLFWPAVARGVRLPPNLQYKYLFLAPHIFFIAPSTCWAVKHSRAQAMICSRVLQKPIRYIACAADKSKERRNFTVRGKRVGVFFSGNKSNVKNQGMSSLRSCIALLKIPNAQ